MMKINNKIKFILLVCFLLVLSGCSNSGDKITNFSVQQVKEEQIINIQAKNISKYDDICVIVSRDDYIVYDGSIKEKLKNGEVKIPVIFGYNNIEIKCYQLNEITFIHEEVIGVYSTEYNIAPLIASLPVVLFSVDLFEISKDVPTFVMLQRTAAYNWEMLPENVYIIPGFNEIDLTLNWSIEFIYDITTRWIGELFEINSNSFFNFYYNESWLSGALHVIYTNKLPSDNYHLTLITDGSGSSVNFNKLYGGGDCYQNYNKLKLEFDNLVDVESWENSSQEFKYKDFSYVMITEMENVELWVTRKTSTYYSSNEKFNNEILNHPRMIVKNLSSMLSSLNGQEQLKLKLLYDFSETFFQEAEETNTKILLVMGTYHSNENNFSEYVNFVMSYYGDDYTYYYKGHPNSPTQLTDGKQDLLNKLGLIDIDSTIPAEMILFFNPDIYACGYSTTSFDSMDDDKVLLVFNEYINANDSYLSKIDLRIQSISNDNIKYGYLFDSKYAINDEMFLIIYYDEKEEESYSIYDSINDVIIKIES